MIETAQKEIGYRETGTNHTKYADQVPELRWSQNMPWCMTFITWAAQHSGNRDLFPATASCETGANWFKKQRQWSSAPRIGALVFYGPRGSTHVELVIGVEPGRIRTVGGNTAGESDGDWFNGNGVYEKWVPRTSRIHGYGLPQYREKSPAFKATLKVGSKGAAVKTWKARMKDRGWRISVNDVYAQADANICKQFQTEKKIPATGMVDEKTWEAAWLLPIT
ncbi:CHAP domain-containing protein [Streptosporangium sp. NPDC020072]|uniref:CHAP domain-containing protein n=1 Tax=Streptosporangium sp. NPDC020072 TaxID=3154788 RepID=UPI003430C73F